MFKENIENTKVNLNGRILKSFCVLVSSCAAFAVFFLSSMSCLYLLIIDTELLGSLGVFNSSYIHASVCAFAVVENIILFMLYIYLRLKKDIYFCLFEDGLDIKLSLSHVYQAVCVYFSKTVRKCVSFLFFLCPATIVSYIFYSLLQNGISYSLLILILVSDFVLLITGVYSYAVYIQKYELIPYVLIKFKYKKIKAIFDMSEKLMEGNCRKLLKLKLCNIPKKLLCLLILPAVYYLPYCKALETDLILAKEKPYLRKHANTEKSVVFYFKPLKET